MIFIGLRGVVIYNYKKQESLLFDVSNGWSGQFDYYKGYCNNHFFIGGRNQIEYFNLTDFSKFNHQLQPLLNIITAGSNVVFTRGASDEKVEIQLPHSQNSLTFSFSAPEFFFPERVEYSYQLSPAENTWQYSNSFNRKITYTQLPPGKYTFRLKAQILGGNWEADPAEYTIIVNPAWWQTTWFKIACIVAVFVAAFTLIRWRIKTVRNQEQDKAKQQQEKSRIEKEILELEAKALRAQMNPHFIFNCMNSIKALIQQKEDNKAITYLTTFSKLIRTIFQNSDKREITLHDELETCRLYTQLESMRFSDKLSYSFTVDETIDLKSIMVPALILQPFIENAIWHGIMPKEDGGTVYVAVSRKEDKIFCVVEDNGIGRELSMRNKFKGSSPTHQSKGVRLTQSRIELNNTLNQRSATVEIIDKTNGSNEPAGTKVILTFSEE
jgi:anti-sigma regulatory factor (Ser/Thr protein kinase)